MRTEVLTTKQAAARLGLSQQRIQQLIAQGKLSAQMLGGNYIVYADDLAALKVYGKPGRPPKPKAEAQSVGAAGPRQAQQLVAGAAGQGTVNGAAQAETKPKAKRTKKGKTK